MEDLKPKTEEWSLKQIVKFYSITLIVLFLLLIGFAETVLGTVFGVLFVIFGILFLLSLLGIFINSCEKSEKFWSDLEKEILETVDFGTPPINYEETIKKKSENVLYDPYSAVYYFDKPQKYIIKVDSKGNAYVGWSVDVKINSKNLEGGYTGIKPYSKFIFVGEDIILDINPFSEIFLSTLQSRSVQ